MTSCSTKHVGANCPELVRTVQDYPCPERKRYSPQISRILRLLLLSWVTKLQKAYQAWNYCMLESSNNEQKQLYTRNLVYIARAYERSALVLWYSLISGRGSLALLLHVDYWDSTIDTTVSLLTSISMVPHYLRAEPVMLLEHPHNNLHLLCRKTWRDMSLCTENCMLIYCEFTKFCLWRPAAWGYNAAMFVLKFGWESKHKVANMAIAMHNIDCLTGRSNIAELHQSI